MRVGRGGAGQASEAAELERGIALGLAPQHELGTSGADGVTVTTPSSSWNHLRCKRCGHTFRRGDRVRVSRPDQTVAHLLPGLGCAGPAEADAAQDEIAMFREGLLSAWPDKPSLRVRRLAAGDWRIPQGPADLRDSNVCLYCGHTFRAGEHVVVCPCQSTLSPDGEDGPPREPPCGRAVHRDPAAGLSCWESWRPTGTVPVCPVTQVKVGDA